MKESRYAAVLRHLASWGYIDLSAEMCVCYLSRLHTEPVLMDGAGNLFCGRIDLDDARAAAAFTESDAELVNNPKYQDQRITNTKG